MIWIMRLKPFLISGGVSLLVIVGIWIFKGEHWRPTTNRFVVVDTSQLIREESESIAREALTQKGASPQRIQKRLEGFRAYLVESLNQFGIQKGVLVFSSNQVFGDLPDVTEEFIRHFHQKGGSHEKD